MNNPSIAPIFAAIDIGSNAARLLIKRLELPEVPGTDAPAQLRKVFSCVIRCVWVTTCSPPPGASAPSANAKCSI